MRQRRNSRRTAGRARLLPHCALLGLLSACQPGGPGPAFDSYVFALVAMLSPKAPGSQVDPPPPPASMQLGIAASGLERLDILSLRGCAVQRTVIRRDTSLGRMAKPSQQLLLALEYLRLAPPCIQRLRGKDAALASALRHAWRRQQAQLPALIFNATLGSDEFDAFWRAAPVPGDYPRVDACETASALRAIEAAVRRWLGGDYRARDRDFELWLAAVAGGAGSALPHAVTELEAQLDAVLPPTYRRWMEARTRRVDLLAAAAQAPQRVGPDCATR